MASWVIARFEAQTQEAIDVAERLVFDMTTGKWTSEANKRYNVAQAMRDWISEAIAHYGYCACDWGIGLGSRKIIRVNYSPLATLQALPEWLPLDDIEIIGPQVVPDGFPDRLAYIRSELD